MVEITKQVSYNWLLPKSGDYIIFGDPFQLEVM
jgi:hypothetical protein